MIELFKKLLDAFLVFFSFKTGKKLGELEITNTQLKADQMLREAYELAAAKIKLESEIHQAYLHKHGITTFPESGIISLHDLDKNAIDIEKLTSKDLLDGRE